MTQSKTVKSTSLKKQGQKTKVPTEVWTEVWRVCPTRSQRRKLDQALDVTRTLYNAALEDHFARLRHWHERGKFVFDPTPVVDSSTGISKRPSNPFFPSAYDHFKDLTLIRQECEEVRALPVTLCRGVLDRAHKAFQAFCKRKTKGQAGGRPRFKPATRWKSLTFSALNGVRLVMSEQKTIHRLIFSPVGALRVRAHRCLPMEAKMVSASLVKTASDRWFAHLSFEAPLGVRERLRDKGDALSQTRPWVQEDESISCPEVSVDWNQSRQAVCSDGAVFTAPKVGERARKTRKKLERQVARARKGSSSRRKKVKALARAREKEANARRTHSHTTARHLVKHFQSRGCKVVAFEELNVKGLMAKSVPTIAKKGRPQEGQVSQEQQTSHVERHPWETPRGSRSLKRHLSDAALGMLKRHTTTKAESAGLSVIWVSPQNTTQTCARCGVKHKQTLTLWDRMFVCEHCDWVCDRDVNAALVVLRFACVGRAHKGFWHLPPSHPSWEDLSQVGCVIRGQDEQTVLSKEHKNNRSRKRARGVVVPVVGHNEGNGPHRQRNLV